MDVGRRDLTAKTMHWINIKHSTTWTCMQDISMVKTTHFLSLSRTYLNITPSPLYPPLIHSCDETKASPFLVTLLLPSIALTKNNSGDR